MRLATVLKTMAFVTLISLGYVHLQMKIINLAYQGKSREKQIRNLIEENGEVTYNILTLKSAMNLGHRLLEETTSMTFADPNNVINMPASDGIFDDGLNEIGEVAIRTEDTTPIFRFLSLGARAEAQVNR